VKHLIQRPASRRRTTLASSITHILTGGTLLLARITRRSADQLAITPGQALWAQIKTVALLG